MAEGLAVVGIVAGFVSIVDVGSKVLGRLNDYTDKNTHLPRKFHGIATDLPLVLDTITRTSEQARSGAVDEATLRKLEPIVGRCKDLVNSLDSILNTLLPKENDSRWMRGKRALLSLTQEKSVQEIADGIQQTVWTLTYYQSVTGHVGTNHTQSIRDRDLERHHAESGINTSSASVNSTRLVYCKNPFVGRETILSTLARSLYVPNQHRRAALFGLGGIGKTRLALETAKSLGKEGISVFWVYVNNTARFEKDYTEILRNNDNEDR